jgi:hypothetical protein
MSKCSIGPHRLVSKVSTSWWSTNHENSSSRQEPEGHAEWTGRGGSRTFDRGGPGDGGDGMEPGPVDQDKGDPDGADPGAGRARPHPSSRSPVRSATAANEPPPADQDVAEASRASSPLVACYDRSSVLHWAVQRSSRPARCGRDSSPCPTAPGRRSRSSSPAAHAERDERPGYVVAAREVGT